MRWLSAVQLRGQNRVLRAFFAALLTRLSPAVLPADSVAYEVAKRADSQLCLVE